MPLGGGKQAFALAVALTLALSPSCAGEHMRDEGAPADAGGGSGGSSAGVGGSAAGLGGSSGGLGGSTAGAGGSIVSSGGAAGTASGGEGGIVDPVCPVCPDANYGVVIHGDGDDLRLEHNPPADGEAGTCSADVFWGSRGHCGSGISFSACENASGSGACVRIVRSMATYADRTGTLWSGSVVSVTHDSASVLTDSGTMTLALTAGDRMLELSLDFAFCASGALVYVVCR